MSTSVVAAIAGAIALLYVLSLLRAVLTLRYGLPVTVPTLAAVDAAWLDERWIDGAKRTLDQLAELGFTLRTYLDGLSPRTAPVGMRCVAVLTNETTGDVAHLAIIERYDDRGDVELIALPIFTRRAGSRRVATSNGDTPGVFVRPRDHAVQAFPMLHNVATLHAAHCAVCDRHLGQRRGELPPAGSEARHANRDSAEEFAYQARRGMLKAKPDGGYERTWRGAFHGVWRLHPRFIGGHKRRIHESGLRLLTRLGITPDPEREPPVRTEAGAGDSLSPDMEAFIASACEEYNAAAMRLHEEWHLDKAIGFHADLTHGTVGFTFPDGHAVHGDVQVLGSWSRKAKSWEWAWNNPNVEAAVKRDAERVREFGEKSGVAYLATGFVPAPEPGAAAYLAAVGAKVVGAAAVIPLPPDADADVVAYAALTNIRLVQSTAA